MPDDAWTVVGRKGKSVSQANAEAADRMALARSLDDASQARPAMPVAKCLQHIAEGQGALEQCGFVASLRSAVQSAQQQGVSHAPSCPRQGCHNPPNSRQGLAVRYASRTICTQACSWTP